jgi:hypothetical protein
MRKVLMFVLAGFISTSVMAQTDTTVRKNIIPPVSSSRAGDHFMFQLGLTSWNGKPDSITTKGLSRTFNAYFLFDFPFKTDPKWSVGIGAGVATDNIYFDKMTVGIKENAPTLSFNDVSDTSNFKKYKLTTAFLEAPVELRFSSKPYENKRSFKVAVGAKIGTLLSAGVKGKTFEDKNGNTLLAYTLKEKSKRYFNQTRLSVTGRIGYGPFSLFTSYAITPLFKEGTAPTVRPMTIGLTISGL